MAAHYWSGHAHGWELAVWWVCIAAPLTVASWARWWPSRRRRLARTAAETARVLREIADAAVSDDPEDLEHGRCRVTIGRATQTRMARDVHPGTAQDAFPSPTPPSLAVRPATHHPASTRRIDTRPLP